MFIELKNITKVYSNTDVTSRALHDVCLKVNKGEMIAIMGRSGSGKSTLLNIIGCLDKATSGEYILEGMHVNHLNHKQLAKIRNQKIGFIFQNYSLIPKYTALENVMLPLLYRKMPYKECKKLAVEALEKFDLIDARNKKPHQLSGGQQQRVAIARAIVGEPEFILADEPTGALDQQNGQDVMLLLKNLNRAGKTIIIVTHDETIADYCEKRIYMKDGTVVG
ncbi:ABC transporter ATP-binding protein [Paenibacillus tyrfis]|uniref:ABC transporter domain-containing protein n=1 Tax=Paenibacillus tyrfis TaxID=1501230 RepID=A0A081P0M0_9BACL|nr:ABC transporter ATP-binding protein [Paenibacillus tyrfis]KEQ24243.1 hypothetical protein ET33_11175 [Paenibacillus tyrfis]